MSIKISLSAGASGLALCALLSACSNASHEAPSQLAARVNDTEISVHQVNLALARAQQKDPAAARKMLDGLVEQELAVQKAVERKLDRDPAVMEAVQAARREVLARAFAESVAAAAQRPDGAEIKAYFDARPALFSERRIWTLQELAVQADPTQLEGLRQRVQTAKAMQDVVSYLKEQKLSLRSNQATTPAESLPAPVLDALTRARDGQALFMPGNGGALIIVATDHRDAPVTLAQATPAIETVLMQQRRRDLVDREMKVAHKGSRVEYLGRFASAASAAAATADATPTPSPAPAASSADTAAARRGLAN